MARGRDMLLEPLRLLEEPTLDRVELMHDVVDVTGDSERGASHTLARRHREVHSPVHLHQHRHTSVAQRKAFLVC